MYGSRVRISSEAPLSKPALDVKREIYYRRPDAVVHMWVSVKGKLRVLGARDEGSTPSTRTRNFDFFENFLYTIYRKKEIVASFKGRKRV